MPNLDHSYGILPGYDFSFVRMTDSPFVILISDLGSAANDDRTIRMADECKAAGKLTLAILSLPIICFDGVGGLMNGLEGAYKIARHVDGVLLFNEDALALHHNCKETEFSGSISMLGASFSDCFNGLIEILEERNEDNGEPVVDSELIESLRDCGPFTVLTGESSTDPASAFNQALKSPMKGKFDLSSARIVIIKICASDNFIQQDLALSEIKKFSKHFPYADINWKFSKKRDNDKSVKVIILATGMASGFSDIADIDGEGREGFSILYDCRG